MLETVAATVLPAGVTGAALSEMEQGWTALLSPEPLTEADLDLYAASRGALLFRLGAILLGRAATPEQERAGEVWALVDLARHSNPADSAAALAAARSRAAAVGWPMPLRPLGMLAALAARDLEQNDPFEEPGAPGRMLRMLRLRLTGR
jgi:phytoene synthase